MYFENRFPQFLHPYFFITNVKQGRNEPLYRDKVKSGALWSDKLLSEDWGKSGALPAVESLSEDSYQAFVVCLASSVIDMVFIYAFQRGW